jgi:flagellar biosynthesis chaperone FliJ
MDMGTLMFDFLSDMDKNKLDDILRELDKIHKEKVELLYDINLLEEYKKRCSNDASLPLINLINGVKSDLEAIRSLTTSVAEIIRSAHPDVEMKRKKMEKSDWMWTERGET